MRRIPYTVLIALILLVCSLSPEGGVIAASTPFGVAYGEGARNLDHFMDYIRDLGLTRTKVSFFWDELEPEPGIYDFTALDQYLSQLRPGDQGLINLFTSGWCTEQGGPCKGSPLIACPYGTPDCGTGCVERYREFILAVANHVKELGCSGIEYWQRDTEPASPFPHFPADSPEEYIELQRVFYEAVKSVFPDVIVVGCNQNGNFAPDGEPTNAPFFDRFLKDASGWFDVLDLRLYEDVYTIPDRVSWFRERMRFYGYDKPIVSTEQGGPDPRTISQNGRSLFKAFLAGLGDFCSGRNAKGCFTAFLRAHRDRINPKLWPFYFPDDPEQAEIYTLMQAADIIARNVIMLAAGVEATWWWNLQSVGLDPIFGRMRLMTGEYEPLPGYYIYKRMVEKLGDVSSIERIGLDDEGIYLYEVKGRDRSGSLYVVWHRMEGADPYDSALAPPVSAALPIGFSRALVTDPFGNETVLPGSDGGLKVEIGGVPLFIENAQ